MSVVEIVDHPLIQHKISLLRDRNTGTKEFRDLVSEIAMLLCYEATRDRPTEEVEVETPVALARTKVLAGRKLALVPILRAGLGMVDGMLNLIPAAKGCKAVLDGSCALVILCCGTGVGMSMCANKIKGIRACCCSDTFSAEFTRRHNNANALCLGGRVVGAGLACQIVDAFLNAEFEGGRHQKRIDKMMALENL